MVIVLQSLRYSQDRNDSRRDLIASLSTPPGITATSDSRFQFTCLAVSQLTVYLHPCLSEETRRDNQKAYIQIRGCPTK